MRSEPAPTAREARQRASVAVAIARSLGRTRPFRVGVYDPELEVDLNDDDLQQVRLELRDSTNFGVSFGGGANYSLRPGFGLGANLRVHAVFQDGEGDTVWYVVPSGHAFVRF